MKTRSMIIGLLAVGLIAATAVLAQQVLDPNQLKISPLNYRGSYIKLKDIFVKGSAGEPVRMAEAGYPLDRYITFGAKLAGIRCFIRRDSINEKLIGQLNPGDQITIIGTVKEPHINLGARRERSQIKLQPIIDVSKIIIGWEEPPPPPPVPAAK